MTNSCDEKARQKWPLDWQNPDYQQVIKTRIFNLMRIRSCDREAFAGLNAYYSNHPADFIEDWMNTYDPRNAAKGIPTHVPFVLFPRQREFINFLQVCLDSGLSGLVEKSRDEGVSWLGVAFSVWLWRYWPGVAIGWGSRKEEYVDKRGDPKSLFEKMRMVLKDLPPEFRPVGFDLEKHCSKMKILNPENRANITGESGDNIGRGGRTTIYFKDESAHYERPEAIEAALGDNTDIQIDISSVNGTANVFYRRRQSGVVWKPGMDVSKLSKGTVLVFVFDWRDDPRKSEEWYTARKEKAEREGLLAKFYQEVDRDYSGAVEGLVIPPQWVKAALDAHKNSWFDTTGPVIGGLDVADDVGRDRNALICRRGNVLTFSKEWGLCDTSETARKAVMESRAQKISDIRYDCIGVGAGVKGELNNLKRNGNMPKNLRTTAWNAGAKPVDADEPFDPYDSLTWEEEKEAPLNSELFANLKAQQWWKLRLRFQNTFKAVQRGGLADEGDLLISISTEDVEDYESIVRELSQPTYTTQASGKIIIDKKPNGASSPNLADAVVMCFSDDIERNGGFFNLY